MDKEGIIKSLRGLLIASKYPMTLRQLDGDYRMIIGERIPFSKLGYASLEEFLRSDDTIKVKRENGEVLVQAVKLEMSAHIVEMKMKEKTKRKSSKPYRSHHKAAIPTRWQPKYQFRHNRNYAPSSRPTALSHSQFVDYRTPAVASKIVVPENSSYHKNLPPRLQKQNSVNSRLKNDKSQDAVGYVRRVLQDFTNSQIEANQCSPGNSRRKVITKMMSEISLDRDSGNSSPVSDISSPGLIPPKVPDLVLVGNPKIDLKNLVDYHKLGPMDVDISHLKNRKTNFYTCKIRVLNESFTSYPEECKTPEAAELICCKEAFAKLSAIYGRRSSLILARDTDILDRIPKMLKKHVKGVWETQLKMDYADKYNEQLPEDWLKIIDSSPCIHVQKVINNYTLRYCKPEEVLQKGTLWLKSMTLSEVSVPSNTVEFKEDADGKISALVEYLTSANEIWCRQIETEESERYVQMVIQMGEFYSCQKVHLHAININQNGYYVAEYDDDWFRVKALEVTDTDVSCFFIDFGDSITLPRTNIYQLKREFAICQAQAFVCRLAGLEDLYKLSEGSEVLRQTLLYNQFILELATEANDDKDVALPVYMYNFETGRSINEELISLLTIESANPNILPETITEVYVSYIAANGDIYVQIHSQCYFIILQLLADLEAQIVQNPPTTILEPITKMTSKNRLYLGKYNLDGHWYRVKIIDWSPKEDMIQIYYIDYGNTEVLSVKEAVLYPLDKLSDVLSLCPEQAVKTRMLLDDLPADFLDVSNKMMPKEEPMIIKIIRYNKDGTPLGEFFKRNLEDGSLFCINKSIAMSSEIKKGDSNNNSSKNPRKLFINSEIKNVPSGGKLKCPTLPKFDECFPVHIPFAVNPYNFFVQPLESRPQLNKMMVRIQDRYKSVMYSPLTVDQIVPGNIYASKYDDGIWYRTSVIKVIHDGSISVFYCDFGYYANVTVQQLIPLDVEFMELPYQALKAKLSRIKPKESNWKMEHCDQFKQMVDNKQFYSVLIKIDKDQLYESDLVLELLLIDTSSEEEDIYIEKELIKKGIAVAV